ncbi:putative Zn-dependent peptidase [Actinoalloteichus sp. GBA129-24]|nr:putative Zn-dependent peptidase [Actinoalloteichus sp. GBA129-24]
MTISDRTAAGPDGARGLRDTPDSHTGLAGHLQDAGTTVVLDSDETGRIVRRTVLPSGLRVVTERMPGLRSASVGMWVAAGSRDETGPEAGAAHYLEHLLFKGTRRRSATQIAEEADAVGGELNAFTSKEHTCYYAHMLDEDLPLAMDLVCDVVFDALLTDQDVEIERGVVLEEIAIRDDDPEDLLHEAFSAALLGEHALGRPVLGTEESIGAMTPDRLRTFYRRSYTPSRMVLAVAGNIEHDEVLRLLDRALAEREPADGETAGARPAAPRRGRADLVQVRDLVLHSDETEQAHLMLGMPGLDRHDERRQVLGVLSAALGGGMSSRLFQEIRERRGLAYSVYSSDACYSDAGSLAVYAGCQPARLGEVAGVVRSVLAEVAEGGLTEAEVARGRGQLRGGLVLGLEDSASRMTRLGKRELNFGTQLGVDDQLRQIDAVGVDQVSVLAADLLRRPISAAVVGPYAHVGELPVEVQEVTR